MDMRGGLPLNEIIVGDCIAELGRLPRRGDTINTDGFSIRVESVRENRIESLRIRERRQVAQRETRENSP